MSQSPSNPNIRVSSGESEIPIVLPDLGTEGSTVGVSAWFVETGDLVETGEKILEVVIPGMTCDVCSPAAGRIARVVAELDDRLMPGTIVAWLAPAS